MFLTKNLRYSFSVNSRIWWASRHHKIKGLFTAAVVHLNFRARSTFPVPVCTESSSMDRTSRGNKVDAVRFYASYRFNLLFLQKQRLLVCCFIFKIDPPFKANVDNIFVF